MSRAKKKGDAGERDTLGDCMAGEVAILRDRTITGVNTTLDPGTAVKVWHVGPDFAFVSPVVGGVEGEPTHIDRDAAVKGMLVRKGAQQPGSPPPDETDPFTRRMQMLDRLL